MEIIKEYTAEFNMFGDTEKIVEKEPIVITKYPNGKFYIHYGWMEMENHKQGTVIAGGYDSLDEAEKMLMKHRPTAKIKIDTKENAELDNQTTINEDIQESSEQSNKDISLEKTEPTPRIDYDKINPEFYQSLKSKDRYTKKMSDDIADKTMNDLNSQGIECSAVRYPKNITGTTVHKNNKETFDKAMNSNFRDHLSKKQSNFIGVAYNSEFYKSLPKENRFINELPAEDGQKFINSLTESKCKFSYRAKDNQKIAITIDNRDSKAVNLFNKFINTIDKSTYMDNIIDILRDKGFAEVSDALINNVLMQLNPLSKLEFGNEAMSTFVNNISPEYTVSQISEIKNITKDIFEQSEIDRLQDTNNLYKKLSDTKADFDLDVSLKQVFSQGYYNDEQKTALKEAIQLNIPTDALSSMIDDTFSADEIKQFTDVYKTYDTDKIQAFCAAHNDKKKNISNQQQKGQFTMSRKSLKEQAERVNKEHSNQTKEKVPEPSIS